MLAAARRAAILERVSADGAVRVADLVADFGVSDMTVRRDLEALAQRQLVSKVSLHRDRANFGIGTLAFARS
jgi:DeoR/GlpR family transcriptional regulator of sugar metabolism